MSVSENTIGFDATYVRKADDGLPGFSFGPGQSVRAIDGLHVWAVASGVIAADDATVGITDGVATTATGTYVNASGVALAAGDAAWFREA